MSWKDQFDLGDGVYLNGANHGPLPRVALEALAEAISWKRDPANVDDAVYFELPDRVRAAAAPFFGCRPQDLAVTTGATAGVGVLAAGIDWRPGDRIVVPAGEFPSNYLTWLSLRDRGVEIDFVAAADGLTAAAVADALRPTTRLVALGLVNFASGFRADVETIGHLCSDRGVAFLVDASQGACALPFDAPGCGATVATCAGYKWMLSPYGTGIFYVDPEWVDRLPVSAVNWTSVQGARDFNNLTNLTIDYRPGALRWDAPETASFFNCMPMAASLELLGSIGADGILRHASGLIDILVAGLPAGFRAASRLDAAHRSSIVRLVTDDPVVTRTAYQRCKDAGLSLSMREDGLRVSPGIWNDAADIERLLEALS